VKTREVIVARGHRNIKATHRTTLEVTKDKNLTKKGDCIVGVDADKSISEISDEMKSMLKEGGEIKVEIYLPDYGLNESLTGYGSGKLTFTHNSDIVIRKSNFICGRTLLIRADKAACDISREIIDLLRHPAIELNLIIVPGNKRKI